MGGQGTRQLFTMDTIQAIEAEISEARASMDEWKESHLVALNAAQEGAVRDADSSEETIKRLYKEEQELLGKAKQMALEHGVEHEKLLEIDQEIAELQCRMQTLPAILQEQNAMIEGQRKKVADLRKALIKAEKDAAHNMTEKRVGQTIFQERLGLKFERVADDNLRVVFNNIDPNDPRKEFWFAVAVDAQNVYQINEKQCKPYVESLPQMLSELNQSNDFGGFVRQMRSQFVQLA